ncbi:hypothetical protein HQ489_04415 [Candidatus Woesearchaeota archaeon]|nr:hypothetical protein [Candidatus Woesearchaeota archaeon]
MIIYNPDHGTIIKEHIEEAEEILNQIPAKYCFITGSFLYNNKYKDIDVFVISRTKKKLTHTNKKVKITVIDFNDLYSLFYHSISKSCISKNILPQKPLKVTISDYWFVINEAVPTIMNEKQKFRKEIRMLMLYMEYFQNNNILDTFYLKQKINSFKDYKEVLTYIKENVPQTIQNKRKKSYLKRFFYDQKGGYKDLLYYDSIKLLYDLAHKIIQGSIHG